MVWKDVGCKTRKMLHSPRNFQKIMGSLHDFWEKKTSPWNFNYDDTEENRIISYINGYLISWTKLQIRKYQNLISDLISYGSFNDQN
jgi:hypothetical protein